MDTQLVADTESFRFIHPDLRAELRNTELNLRAALQQAFRDAFNNLTADALAAVAPSFELLANGIPAQVVASHFKIWQTMTELMSLRDVLKPTTTSMTIN